MDKTPEIMKNRYIRRKRNYEKSPYQVGHDTGMMSYGEVEVRRLMQSGAVRLLILSESLDLVRVTVKCSACGYEEQHTLKKSKNLISRKVSLANLVLNAVRRPLQL